MKALQLIHLDKQYTNRVHAVQDLSLEVEQGEFFGLLGPNGAGKSTTIGIVSSLIKKTSGQVKIFDYDLDLESEKAKAQLGLVPQEFNINFFEKVIDILIHQAGYYGVPFKEARDRAEWYLKKLDMWHKAFEPARSLSGGLKRRLLIIRALIHKPRLLILDEPTAGVDIELRRLIWSFLEEMNQQGTTIILTTHYLEEAETLCRRIAIIDKGKIVQNMGMKELLATLKKETLLLDLQKPLNTTPVISGFQCKIIDELTLEVSFFYESSLNTLFEALSKIDCQVRSFRNKANRLEELFLDLTHVKASS